jgi:Protein of unknown function (DUF2380)
VKSRSLRQCIGCEAAVALKLGADQSFIGVVTRIGRTEYVMRFQIRDARTGAPIIARQSDLRIGADYSWNRGAAALINRWVARQSLRAFGRPGSTLVAKLSRRSQFRPGGCVLEEYFCSVRQGDDDGETAIRYRDVKWQRCFF